MTTLEKATFAYHLDQLDALDSDVRMTAAREVLRLCGLSDAVRAVAADGALRPPPQWPLVDIVPLRAERIGAERWLVAGVRTQVGGVLVEEVRVSVPIRDGALAEAVERGRWALGARLGRMVVA